MEGYGETIKRWRARRGWSQQQLAVAVGMSAAAVTQWERELVLPRRETAMKIDDALEAGGEVLAATGHGRTTSDHEERISQLEEEVRQLQATVVQLLERAMKDVRPVPRQGRRATAGGRSGS